MQNNWVYNDSYHNFDISKGPYRIDKALHSGGEREIRTLGRVLAVTRFPVGAKIPPSQTLLYQLFHLIFCL